jgi:hypothetical protein
VIRIRRFVDWRTPEGVLQILGAIFLLLLFVVTGRPNFTNASKPPGNLGSSLIALEQAHSVSDIDAILSDVPSPDREVLRIKQYVTIAILVVVLFIAVIATSRLMRRRRTAIFIGVLGLAVCVLGLLESIVILRLIETPLSATAQNSLDQLRLWSTGKWATFAALTACISLFFLVDRRSLLKFVGVLDLIAAIALAVGLAQISLLPVGGFAACVAVALSAVTLKFSRHEESSPRNSVSRSV